jgi:hypothetical protein
MDKMGAIVLLPGCGDGIVVSRLMGAPPGGRSVSNVCPSLVIVFTCCGWWGSLILRVRLVGALCHSSSCFRPHLLRLCGYLCSR